MEIVADPRNRVPSRILAWFSVMIPVLVANHIVIGQKPTS